MVGIDVMFNSTSNSLPYTLWRDLVQPCAWTVRIVRQLRFLLRERYGGVCVCLGWDWMG